MAYAPRTLAANRAALAELLTRGRPAGSLLLATCHRVELYAQCHDLVPLRAEAERLGAEQIEGLQAARHLVMVAVGRESAVLGEDQILHQLRDAVRQARADDQLHQRLDRLADAALRAGRKARSWLPVQRGNVAELAVSRVIEGEGEPGRPVLIVGSGAIGRLAASALRERGTTLIVTSRSAANSKVLATQIDARHVPFDPGTSILRSLGGVVVGLAGTWRLSAASARALLESGAWVIDLSAPPAVPETLGSALGARLRTIDDFAIADEAARSPADHARLVERLGALVELTLADYTRWLTAAEQRSTAAALSERAAAAQSAELEQLWQRVPTLDEGQRAEVARAVRGVTRRLLGDPLEQLGSDHDGRRAVAARDLFRL